MTPKRFLFLCLNLVLVLLLTHSVDLYSIIYILKDQGSNEVNCLVYVATNYDLP